MMITHSLDPDFDACLKDISRTLSNSSVLRFWPHRAAREVEQHQKYFSNLVSFCRSNMQCFSHHLDTSPRRNVVIPTSVEKYMYRSFGNLQQQKPVKKRSFSLARQLSFKRHKAKGAVFDDSTRNNPAAEEDATNKHQRDCLQKAAIAESADNVGRPRAENTVAVERSKKRTFKDAFVAEGSNDKDSTKEKSRGDPESKSKSDWLGTEARNRENSKLDESGALSSELPPGGLPNKKRKLPWTLMSRLQPKRQVSILGFFSTQRHPVSTNVTRTSETETSQRAENDVQKLSSASFYGLITKDAVVEEQSESGFDCGQSPGGQKTLPVNMERVTIGGGSTCGESEASGVIFSSVQPIVQDADSLAEVSTDSEDSSPDQVLNNSSKWTSVDLSGFGGNETDNGEECPFCDSCNDSGDRHNNEQVADDPDVALVGDLIEDEARHLKKIGWL